MKKIASASKYLLFILLSFANMVALAQDSTVATHKTVTTTTTNEFVIQPWMYIVGGIVLLGIVITLLSGGKKEVVRTTVIKDTRA